MTKEFVLIGPPGTGKTTHLISIFKALTAGIVQQSDIERSKKVLGGWVDGERRYRLKEALFITFSTSAENELISRITGEPVVSRARRTGITNQIRTIHSTATTLLISGTPELSEMTAEARKATKNLLNEFNGNPFAAFARENRIPYDPTGERIKVGNAAENLYTKIINTLPIEELMVLQEKLLQSPDEFLMELRGIVPAKASLEASRLSYPLENTKIPWIIDRYIVWKWENNVFDFSDVLLHAYLGGYTPFGTKLQHIRFLLLDEAQDFSPLAWRLIRYLKRVNGIELAVTAGDPLQSIYSFQGADLTEFLRFMEDIKNHDGRIHVLDYSRRLTQNVKNFALSVIKDQVALLEEYGIKYDFRARDEEAKIQIYNAPDQDLEVTVKQLIPTIQPYLDQRKKVLILARTNEIVHRVKEVLLNEGIGVMPLKRTNDMHGRAMPFLERVQEVLDKEVLTEEEASWFLKYTVFGAGVRMATPLTRARTVRENLLYLAKAVLTGRIEPEDIQGATIYIDGRFIELEIPHDFRDVALTQSPAFPVPTRLDIRAIQKLFEKLKSSPKELLHMGTIERELGSNAASLIEAMVSKGKKLDNVDIVYVDTMHASKGHEGDVSIVLDHNDSSYLTKDDLKEEARLLFVAMTRARESLILVQTRHSILPRVTKPSRAPILASASVL
ncbi:ATP-dependent helicase [Thermococcus sp. GR6]|uniref:UvrD-helicase domain-containing protein n=1 Tax=Thermococcus sp. GR6 TaxID=1638256 RepID=UPI001430AB45|nr:ATP-dependent helicase [Thermococcus sp. GR6]NJE42911.1 ATP-dependent helicase [Thermococcus sp. GR6]